MKRRTFRILLFFLLIVSSTHAQLDKKSLKEQIDSTIGGLKCDVSVTVVSADKYDVLYSYNADAKMIPASITKVITSASALMKLGKDYFFKTAILTDDINIDDGVIDGNLYLKGYGDPDFSTSDLRRMADNFTKLGITSVKGNLIYDESFLDNEYGSLSGVYKSDTDPKYWPYVTALSLNKNNGSKDPAFEAANLLAEELLLKNIAFDGIIISGTTPSAAKELVKNLRPLENVISNMNKPSDNQSALTVFKVLGAEMKSPPGTLEKGAEVVSEFLTSIGIDRKSFEILEGSGLTRYNVVTSSLYVQLLKFLYDQVNVFDKFLYSLSIAGVDGTLKNRMKDTEAQNNVYAKTGTLNNVSTLAGYAISRDNELLIFYIAMNNFKGDAGSYRKKQDKICELICQFSRN
jgi:D-alanyl-D-alanine carboxypeptidase/D-alanyl-D-alanine-endopeptidase (penicillin-binding protein 4)